MAENELDNLLTIDEAARLMKVHPNTLRIRIRAGTLRALKFGRQWRIPRDALLEALKPSDDKDAAEGGGA